MDKLKKIPKWVYVVVGFIILITFSIATNDNSNNTSNGNGNKEKYEYVSNNPENKDFMYSDIDKSELAVYEKYISEEANKIMNQKIYIKVVETNTFEDRSTATTKDYTAIAVDHDGNKWKITSDFHDSFVKINKKNIKIYGVYQGIEKDGDEVYPLLKVYTHEIDADYIDKDAYKDASQKYIDKLNEKYKKESFVYEKLEESIVTVDVVYINKNKDIEITVSVDPDDMHIWDVEANIIPIDIKFDDVDDEFWYSVISSFHENVSKTEAYKIVSSARADGISKTSSTILELNDGQATETGTYLDFDKKIKVQVDMYIRQLRVTQPDALDELKRDQ